MRVASKKSPPSGRPNQHEWLSMVSTVTLEDALEPMVVAPSVTNGGGASDSAKCAAIVIVQCGRRTYQYSTTLGPRVRMDGLIEAVLNFL
jgi:hypothetical protein